MSKKLIDIFMKEESANGGCCCSGSSNCCGGQYISIDELVQRFEKRYKDVGEIKIHKLTGQNRYDFIQMLNKVLMDSGEKIVVNKLNMDFILSKILPLISVDGRIISVKNYPNEQQLYKAIVTGERIPTQPSCC